MIEFSITASYTKCCISFIFFVMDWETQPLSIPIHIGILKIGFCKQHQQTCGTFSHCGGLQSYIYMYIGTLT